MNRPTTFRFSGTSKPRMAPFGGTWDDAGAALCVELPETTRAQDAAPLLPDPTTLSPGTWVVVLPNAARGRGLLAAFGRKPITRAVRAGALLLRGYVDIAAEVDVARNDLVFGRVR